MDNERTWFRRFLGIATPSSVNGNIIVILTVYVDDILITGGDQQLVDQKKKELTDRFEMTDMGEVKRILGIDVQRDYEQGTLAISQEHYVNTLLERF